MIIVGDQILLGGSLAAAEVAAWLGKAQKRLARDFPKFPVRLLVDTSRAARIVLPCPPPDPPEDIRFIGLVDEIFAGMGRPLEGFARPGNH
jgi:hypothetical protein